MLDLGQQYNPSPACSTPLLICGVARHQSMQCLQTDCSSWLSPLAQSMLNAWHLKQLEALLRQGCIDPGMFWVRELTSPIQSTTKASRLS